MKTILFLLLSIICTTQIQAQNSAVLDSLRYYPDIKLTKFAYESNGSAFDGINYFQIGIDFDTLKNNKVYKSLYSGIVDYDQMLTGEYYERIDSTTGLVYRSSENWTTNFEGPLSVTTVISRNYKPQTMSRVFKDSSEFPIERLYFDEKPNVGDTVLVGSARFAGSEVENKSIDSIAAKDILVIYRGYREVLDRELGFDNPADTLFKLLDFEIRYAFSSDSLLTYTLAKDIGLLEVSLYSYSSDYRAFEQRRAQVYETEVNNRTFTRLGLYVSNEKLTEIPNKISIQAFPNPFNPSTTIRYNLPQSGEVNVQVFDMLGRLVQTLEQGFKPFGSHTVPFNATALSSGIYLVRVKSQNEIMTTKVVLMK